MDHAPIETPERKAFYARIDKQNMTPLWAVLSGLITPEPRSGCVPALWRFHAVHHIDLDLDSTTGLRFHFGELALAAGFRAAQVLLLGVDRDTLRVWQQALVVSVIFHHSNLELPIDFERRLVPFLVTPRMHGIHHSRRSADMNSNYSSLLSWWDRLHRSLRLNVPQASVTIGIPGFSGPEDVTLAASLTLPFRQDPRLQALRNPESQPLEVVSLTERRTC